MLSRRPRRDSLDTLTTASSSSPSASTVTASTVNPCQGKKPSRLSSIFSSSFSLKSRSDLPSSACSADSIDHFGPGSGSGSGSGVSSNFSRSFMSLSSSVKMSKDESPSEIYSSASAEEARRIARQHAQFGPLIHPSHRYISRHDGGAFPEPVMDEPPYYYLFTTYISYLILIAFGHVRDFFGKRFREQNYRHLKARDGYGALNSDFDNFYVRRLKLRINDCFERPVTGVPGRHITLIDRKTDDHNRHFYFTGTTTETLNLSSYNYLGFAQSEGPCADAVEETLRKYGITSASTRSEAGTQDLHVDVEDTIAKFVGKEASMVFSMGFVTNGSIFPALVSKGCLLISDELNHASIRFGTRLSGCSIKIFAHNDMKALERTLRHAIAQGQPRTHRPWKKILVVVEGLYSMEGSMVNLPGLLELKKKYKFYLYIDEAHSIGAIGPHGKGVCDFFNVDPKEVDILMGTFTKSFGANGGYIAADKAMIDSLRASTAAVLYAESPTPPVLTQIYTALKIINGDMCPGEGEERLQRLAFNSRYLRLGLKRLGFIVYGHDDSPVIPILLYNPAKMPAFSHEMLKRKISVVIVGYPATPLVSSRARFCVSAAHTKDDLDRVLSACDEIGNVLQLKISSGVAGGHYEPPVSTSEKEGLSPAEQKALIKPPRWRYEDIVKRGVHDVQFPLY
ncbi:Pyridoxal phosphate-dependent transferase, major domain protein [Ascosphaera apis ARSEF 7405]|uniref:serine C-palmitoyltransferase n=1 Tax=Ascosphaera apis ARSEF 7405 TaxID=392613 RepID=A0A166NR75_9EURO|nr:Pyridoxal phosphate-dependent transferase, major domain protein [Ascosphaera apis ARSEF 7405]